MRLIEESSVAGRRHLQSKKGSWSRGVWRGGLVLAGLTGCTWFAACGGSSSSSTGGDDTSETSDAGDASVSHESGDDASTMMTTHDAGGTTIEDAGMIEPSDAAKLPTYTISGQVTGYTGSGLVLEDNAGDALPVTAGTGATTPFTFATSITQGQMYTVAVQVQPGMPTETCSVTNATGVATADVTNVAINCVVDSFNVGLTVTGLIAVADGGITDAGPADSGFFDAGGDAGLVAASKNTLVLTDNAGDVLEVSSDGTYTFPSQVPSGSMFDVEIARQPIYPQTTCALSGNTGTVLAGDVSSIAVNCTPTMYTLGGNVGTSLKGAGLVLDDGLGHKATINSSGIFSFPIPLDSGQTYNVTVTTQPSVPTQTCTVTNPTGTITGANVTNLGVACTTNTYAVGYAVTGLATGQSLVLTDKYNGTTNDTPVTVTSTSAQSGNFATKVASNSTYAVTAATQAMTPQQTCTVGTTAVPASGTIGSAAVSVPIACVTKTYTVGGSVSGLPSGVTMKIQDNGGDEQTLTGVTGTAVVPFTFATAVASGSPYVLTVSGEPTGDYCTFVNGSGTITTANVTNLAITCRAQEPVAVLYADSTNSADVIASLTAAKAFSKVDGINYLTTPPTLATLQTYNAVLVYSVASFDTAPYDAGNRFAADAGTVTLGNLLAQYLTNNAADGVPGRVVSMAETDISGNNELAGGFSTYSSLSLGAGLSGPNGLNKIDVTTTSLTSGVSTLDAIVAIHGNCGLNGTGALKIAEWGDGTPLITTNTYKIGTGATVYNRADLNFFPVSSAANANFWTGDGAQLMVNALLYR